MIDRQQLIGINPIAETIKSYGISLIKSGSELKGLCPFHQEKTPSFHVNPIKQTFHCFGCGIGGSVIDFVSKKENLTIKQTMEKLDKNKPNEIPKKESKIVAKYEYQDEQGNCLYKVFRFEPKTFRQAHQVNGKTVWSMEGVKRVLYRLPFIIKSDHVIVCEGEKDADALASLGFQSTCNVGGAGKWMEGYNESLRGKTVTILPDNDEAGAKHCEKVKESLLGKVKSLKIIKVPEEFKDISEWIEKNPSGDHKACIESLINQANPVGLDIPVFTIGEMEDKFKEFIFNSGKNVLTFDWLPSLKKEVTSLVPGDVMTILADTGAGKTAFLQNLAFHARPLKVLFFEMELADQLMFKRFTQLRYKVDAQTVENAFRNDMRLGEDDLMSHIFVCPQSKQTVESIEKFIIQSELKIGEKPQVVIIDYIGLIQGEGKTRYEKMSNTAESLKRLAKSTNTIIVVSSQIHRKGDDDQVEIYLHDAKDSGSIECSAGLSIALWRETHTKMIVKMLKNSSGMSGNKFPCHFDGRTMTITESNNDKIVSYTP